MKFGHVESTLLGATPRSWRDEVTDAFNATPTVVVVVGAGGVLLISMALIYWLGRASKRR
jgi:hypothetical protein